MNTIIFGDMRTVRCNGEFINYPINEHMTPIEQTLVKRNYSIYRLQFDPDIGIAKATWTWRGMHITKDFPNGSPAYKAVKAIFKEAFDQLEREG